MFSLDQLRIYLKNALVNTYFKRELQIINFSEFLKIINIFVIQLKTELKFLMMYQVLNVLIIMLDIY